MCGRLEQLGSVWEREAEMGGTERPVIEDLRGVAIGPMLALNNRHAEETSVLDEGRLAELIRMACFTRGMDGGGTALLIAMDESAEYENANFGWFKARYERFVYVDRIILSDALRGRGVARELYEELFAWALAAGQRQVVCEVNLLPPNPVSDAFHWKMGFVEVGRAENHGGAKTVRYLRKELG